MNSNEQPTAPTGVLLHPVVSRIVEILKADDRRDIYISARNDYWISYQGGGPWPLEAVRQMVSAGLLKQKWPNVECYILVSNSANAEVQRPRK